MSKKYDKKRYIWEEDDLELVQPEEAPEKPKKPKPRKSKAD